MWKECPVCKVPLDFCDKQGEPIDLALHPNAKGLWHCSKCLTIWTKLPENQNLSATG